MAGLAPRLGCVLAQLLPLATQLGRHAFNAHLWAARESWRLSMVVQLARVQKRETVAPDRFPFLDTNTSPHLTSLHLAQSRLASTVRTSPRPTSSPHSSLYSHASIDSADIMARCFARKHRRRAVMGLAVTSA